MHNPNHATTVTTTSAKPKTIHARTELRQAIRCHERSMQRMLEFALGKRALRCGKYAKRKIIYQPEDYLRLGRTLCELKQHILQLQEALRIHVGNEE